MEEIARFLSFSADCCGALSAIKKVSPRGRELALQWLDDSGLAFYFLQKLKDTKEEGAVPNSMLSRLEQNFAANQSRSEDMSRRFALLNNAFNDAGIRYLVIKGFSLVPEFCPYAPLRYQGDFDYLLDTGSLPAARRVLVEHGYIAKDSRSRREEKFVTPGGQPSRSAEQYSLRAPHAVELHTDVWDSGLHGVPAIPELFSVERATNRRWDGSSFPALSDEDAFLGQVVHACHHLFTLWIRTSCLFEIAYFLNRRAGDTELWNRIELRVGDSAILREFVVIVAELAARLFASPLPPLVQVWGASLRPASRIWIEHYAHRWAFCELPVYQFSLFPRSKLALFLRQQYEGTASQESGSESLPPTSRLSRIASSLRNEPSLILNADWWKRQLLVRRSIFHAMAGARYVCEIPRWWWLNRTRVRTAAESS